MLRGGILADYTNGEYSHFYKLDDEALGMVKKAWKESKEVDDDGRKTKRGKIC